MGWVLLFEEGGRGEIMEEFDLIWGFDRRGRVFGVGGSE